MTPEELRLDEAKRWLRLAARDLHVALLVLTEEPSASLFHSQQAVEKTEKALLALHNVPFRKTHDLRELGRQCAILDSSLTDLLTDAANLTDYAIVFRYLDAPREPDAAEAGAGLETAKRVYEAISARLSPRADPELAQDASHGKSPFDDSEANACDEQ
jgi:HEPN domain-containing protein